jgi:hypothetical protein
LRNFARRDKRDAGLHAELRFVEFESVGAGQHEQPRGNFAQQPRDEPHAGYSMSPGRIA